MNPLISGVCGPSSRPRCDDDAFVLEIVTMPGALADLDLAVLRNSGGCVCGPSASLQAVTAGSDGVRRLLSWCAAQDRPSVLTPAPRSPPLSPGQHDPRPDTRADVAKAIDLSR